MTTTASVEIADVELRACNGRAIAAIAVQRTWDGPSQMMSPADLCALLVRTHFTEPDTMRIVWAGDTKPSTWLSWRYIGARAWLQDASGNIWVRWTFR